jgi:2-methylcitrate dehydratase PrpD
MGFTAPQTMIEGDLGLLDVLTEAANKTILLDQLGEKFYVTHLSVKPYPT